MTSRIKRRRLLSIAIVLLCGAGTAWYVTDKFEETAAGHSVPSLTVGTTTATDEHLTTHSADDASSDRTVSARSTVLAPANGGSTPAAGEALAILQARLEQETQARELLAREVGELRAQIAAVQQEVKETGTRPTDEEDVRDASNSRRPQRRVDEQAFIDAGIAPDRAADLARRLADTEMSRLYLRDRAIREDWINTPRYTEAFEKLNQRQSSLRDELDEQDYEAYLYATGRPNRVAVEGVIESSPAQEVGLEPGDILLSYDGDRIFTGDDLRAATTQGEIDELVIVEYLRDGVPIQVKIPRGPMGVQIYLDRAEPGT